MKSHMIADDHIIRVRNIEETWVKQEVIEANMRLLKKNRHSQLRLQIGDCWSTDLLYGVKQKDILLNEHLYVHPEKINQILIKLPFSLYGAHYLPTINWDINIVQDFNWFTHRNDPNRQFYFYDLYRRDWLDAGFVSFIGYSLNTGQSACLTTFDRIHEHYYAPEYDDIGCAVRSLIPYRNFEETGNLCDIIMQSKFSIVIETYIERTDVVCFSEKIFRVLQLPRPWLLLGSTNSVKTLRDLGFYVFDDFVDHQYDAIDTTQSTEKKYQAIMEQAACLRKLVINDRVIDHWRLQTQKNRDLMKGWNSRLRDEVRTAILQAEDIADQIVT